VLSKIRQWLEHRQVIRRRWQADARALVAADEVNAYCEAQRRATRARVRADRAAFYHWAKVAAEVARIAPLAEMDIDVVRAVVSEEERRRT
jgi:hypothetical protein